MGKADRGTKVGAAVVVVGVVVVAAAVVVVAPANKQESIICRNLKLLWGDFIVFLWFFSRGKTLFFHARKHHSLQLCQWERDIRACHLWFTLEIPCCPPQVSDNADSKLWC